MTLLNDFLIPQLALAADDSGLAGASDDDPTGAHDSGGSEVDDAGLHPLILQEGFIEAFNALAANDDALAVESLADYKEIKAGPETADIPSPEQILLNALRMLETALGLDRDSLKTDAKALEVVKEFATAEEAKTYTADDLAESALADSLENLNKVSTALVVARLPEETHDPVEAIDASKNPYWARFESFLTSIINFPRSVISIPGNIAKWGEAHPYATTAIVSLVATAAIGLVALPAACRNGMLNATICNIAEAASEYIAEAGHAVWTVISNAVEARAAHGIN